MRNVYLSLCDITLNGCLPWIEAGYEVVAVDPQHGTTTTADGVTRLAGTIEDAMPLIGELRTGGGFVMPQPAKDPSLGKPDNRIHFASPGPERANFRSATPMGFARAVFEANHQPALEAAA